MIRATFPTAAIEATGPASSGRTVAGVAVPWNVTGTVADGRRVKFLPGSLDPAARPILLRDHDRVRPIGVVVDARDDGTQMHATGRVSATRDGDDALVLAADGALPAFSVGAEPTDWTIDTDGVLVVVAAAWQELSLLTFGAFPTATVASVTATQPEGTPMITTADPANLPASPDDDALFATAADHAEPDQLPGIDPVTAGSAVPNPLTAPAPAPVPVAAAASRPRPTVSADLSIRDIAELVAAAATGRIEAGQVRRRIATAARGPGINAQLTNVTLVGTNNVNFDRPTYAIELVDLISWGRPTVDAISRGDLRRGDYPSKAFAGWDIAPTVGVQANEKDLVNSTPVKLGPRSTPVITWAGGNDLSQQVVDFGSEGFVEDYIRAAAADYAKKSNVYAVTQLLAGATGVESPAADSDWTDNLIALLGGLDPTKVPASALVCGMSWDVGVQMAGIKDSDKPAFWTGTINFGRFLPDQSAGGLSMYVDPSAPAGSMWLGPRDGVRWWEFPGSPANIRVIDAAHLGLDVTVYGYGAFAYLYPGSFVKITPNVP